MKRTGILFLSFLLASIGHGQSAYKGLTPGEATRSSIQAVLGSPVRDISQTLTEYNSGDGTGKVYVQFATNSDVSERIEIVLSGPSARETILTTLSLPTAPSSSKVNSRGKLEEYFGNGKFIVLSHASSEQDSDILRIGYYSSKLFSKSTGSKETDNQDTVTKTKPAPPAQYSSCFGDDTGTASVNANDHFQWAKTQSAEKLKDSLSYKLNRLFKCGLSRDRIENAYGEVSAAIAKAAPSPDCYNGDEGSALQSPEPHRQWAVGKSADFLANAAIEKVHQAFGCLNSSQHARLFSSLSVIVASNGRLSIRDSVDHGI